MKAVEENISQYLESSSNKKELLTALLESSVIITLMLEITYVITEYIQKKIGNKRLTCQENRDFKCQIQRIDLARHILQNFSLVNLHLKIHCVCHICHPSTLY